MAWLRVDDTSLTHPKVLRLHGIGDREGLPLLADAVVGFVMLTASWSGQHLTDCFIPCALGPLAAPGCWEQLAAAAVEVGMLTAHTDEHGQAGWIVTIGDGLFHLMSRKEVELNREKRNGPRRLAMRIETILRDGDQCRYCAHTVQPHDHKSRYGRQIDHVDPEDRTTPLVVSCKGCNGMKGRRTPDGALMELLPPPEEPFYQPATLAWLLEHGATPRPGNQPANASRADSQSATAPATPGTQPAATQRRALPEQHARTTRPEPDPSTRALPDPVAPGRVGPGLVGSGHGPRRRGRGRRGGS